MKREIFGFIVLSVIVTTFIIATNYLWIKQHESVHEAVFENMGCRIKEKVITPFKGHVTGVCSDEKWNETSFLNSQVEIVGYHLYPIYFLLSLNTIFNTIFMTSIVCLLRELIKENRGKEPAKD